MRALLAEVAGRRFALPLGLVRKVLPAVEVTPLANAPRAVLGLVDVRGVVHAVVSVERALGLGPGEVAARHHFVLVAYGSVAVALHVERALEVVDLPGESELEPLGAVVPGDAPRGRISRTADGLIVVHELRSFLEEADVDALARTLAVQPEPEVSVP